MGENTAIREKKAKAGIKEYAKALGVLVSPVLAFFLVDVYSTMKQMSTGFVSLQSEVKEMRDREMDSFRRNLVTLKRDLDEMKIKMGIMEGLYAAAPWSWEEAEKAAPPDQELEALRREIERLEGERDYYEEFEQYEQMQRPAPQQKK